MKTSVYRATNGIEIEYILCRSPVPSDTMVVAFPGPVGMRGGEWGYLLTIRQFKNVNVLFPRTSPEISLSRMTYLHGEPVYENAMIELATQSASETGSTRLISVGSSMGGWCALYYGLKYGWDIISGSPPYHFAKRGRNFLQIAGDRQGREKEWLDQLLPTVIREAGMAGYEKQCFISWGIEEPFWREATEGPQLVKDMEKAGIRFKCSLYPFSDHMTVRELFPQVLRVWLPYFLGMSGMPSEDMKSLMASPKAGLIQNLERIYREVPAILRSCQTADPHPSIKGCFRSKTLSKWIGLRNYVYAKEGWYWGTGKDREHPVELKDGNSCWRMSLLKEDSNMLSFEFQDAVLQYYEVHGATRCLEWLVEDARQYFRMRPQIPPSAFTSPSMNLRRMLYFISLHTALEDAGIPAGIGDEIAAEVGRSLSLHANMINRTFFPRWHVWTVLGLLHAAAYFRQHREISEKLAGAAAELLGVLLEYHFDRNGICRSGQIDWQDMLAYDVVRLMDFAEKNRIENDGLRTLQEHTQRIASCAAHIAQPDERLAPIGHTTAATVRRTRPAFQREPGNLVLRTSNIAFLEYGASYLTVGGGANTRSQWKHCDLLSFTWYYCGQRIFCDAGGGIGRCEAYASSAIAHNAFLCDDQDYITPEYDDWTTMNEVVEKPEYVLITMSHHLIDSVRMERKLLWIKPNIVVLVDRGTSDAVHSFRQNFLMAGGAIISQGERETRLQVSKRTDVRITQHDQAAAMGPMEFRGTDDVGDETHYRGSLIRNWESLHKGLNLVYSKRGSSVQFMTAIECHAPAPEDGRKERMLREIRTDDGGFVAELADGGILREADMDGMGAI